METADRNGTFEMRFNLLLAVASLFVSLIGELSGEEAQNMQQLRLLVCSNHFGEFGLVIIDVPSMKSRLLKKGNLYTPSWSPDGKRIVYGDSSKRIAIMNADGTDVSKIIPTPHPAYCPAWSPAGNEITFTAFPEGEQSEVYTMNADGSDPVNLSNHSALDAWSAWSPDGKKLAFSSHRDNISRLFVMNADGSNQRALLNKNIHYGSYPAWSPDGKMIAFSNIVSSDGDHTEVFVTKTDGSKVRQITHNKHEMNWLPAWSPDGRYIAYVSFEKWGEEKSLTGDLVLFDIVNETQSKVLSGVSRWTSGRPAWKPLIKQGIEE